MAAFDIKCFEERMKEYIADFEMSKDTDYEPFIRRFRPGTSYSDMIELLWAEEEFHKKLFLNVEVADKKFALSKQFLRRGNEEYRKQNFAQALDYYNKAIINAINKDPDFILGQAYAERSALVFSLGKYEQCLRDISKAVEAGCSRKDELMERMKNCYKELGMSKTESPEEEFFSSSSTVEEFVVARTIAEDNVGTMLPCCEYEAKVKAGGEPENLREKYSYLFAGDHVKTPDVKEENVIATGLTAKANISYAKGKERIIVASEDIFPGEIVLKERMYVCSITEDQLHNYCVYCLKRAPAPVPCPKCTSVVFCDERCLTLGLNEFHRIECPIFSVFIENNLLSATILAVRSIIKVPFPQLKNLVLKCKKEEKGKRPGDVLGFDESGTYNSQDYRTIFHLEAHKPHRAQSALLSCCIVTLSLLKLVIEHTEYLPMYLNQKFPLPGDAMLFGETLFKNLLNVSSNGYQKTETNIPSLRFPDNELNYGIAVSSLFALMSHSCDHNVTWFNYGPVTICRATQFIRKDQELTVSYKHKFHEIGPASKRGLGLDTYFFKCRCDACINDWPQYCRLPAGYAMICSKCGWKALDKSFGCRKCRATTFPLPSGMEFNGETSLTVQDLDGLFANCWEDYRTISTKIMKEKFFNKEMYKKIIDCITVLSMFGKKPSILHVSTQELLERLCEFNAYHKHNF